MRPITASLTSLSCFVLLAGCMASTDDFGSVNDGLTLVDCETDRDCGTGETCLAVEERGGLVGYCTTGDRCTSSRQCEEGSVCRGGDGLHCLAVERDGTDEPLACPRGSTSARILCAPGFELLRVSREPACYTCEPLSELIDRCREAGLSPERCRHLIGGGDEPTPVADRCRAAGISPERCRALTDDSIDDDAIVARCREAGLTTEECRAWVSTSDDEFDIATRCREAGLTTEECRALVSSDRSGAAERCRAAGLTIEECRALVSGESTDDRARRCIEAGIDPTRCRALIEDGGGPDPLPGRRVDDVDVVDEDRG